MSLRGIIYVFQKSFDNCRNKNNKKLKFDFYIPEKNILIEFDGRQYYKPINYFDGQNYFKKLIESDKIKNNIVKINNNKLIRISYLNYNNIEKI